jgi:hypothetical protein
MLNLKAMAQSVAQIHGRGAWLLLAGLPACLQGIKAKLHVKAIAEHTAVHTPGEEIHNGHQGQEPLPQEISIMSVAHI